MAYVESIQLPDGSSRTIRDPEALHTGDALKFIISTNAATTPAGVTWQSGSTTITGTLDASATTASSVYLVPNGGSGKQNYDEYVSVADAGAPTGYKWEKIGSADIDISNKVDKGTYTTSTPSTANTGSTSISVPGSSFSFEGTGATHTHAVTGWTQSKSSPSFSTTKFVTDVSSSGNATTTAVLNSLSGIELSSNPAISAASFDYKTQTVVTGITKTTATAVTAITPTSTAALSGATMSGTALVLSTANYISTFTKSTTTVIANANWSAPTASVVSATDFATSAGNVGDKTGHVVLTAGTKPDITWTTSTTNVATSGITGVTATKATTTITLTTQYVTGVTFSLATVTLTPAGNITGTWTGSHTHTLNSHTHSVNLS